MKTINEESNKPKLLVVGESIEVLGLNLLIEPEVNGCTNCVFNIESRSILCRQVDCDTNDCIISQIVI